MITIRCTRSRGPRGFFCLHVFRRGPVNVAVITPPQSGMAINFRFTISTMLIATLVCALVIAVCLRNYGPGHVSIRINGAVAITHDEIVSVDWNSQSYTLTDNAHTRIANMAWTTPPISDFSITVNEDVVSTGYYMSPLSSHIPTEGPVTYLIDNPNVLRPTVIPKTPPATFRSRLYTSLWMAGKLSD